MNKRNSIIFFNHVRKPLLSGSVPYKGRNHSKEREPLKAILIIMGIIIIVLSTFIVLDRLPNSKSVKYSRLNAKIEYTFNTETKFVEQWLRDYLDHSRHPKQYIIIANEYIFKVTSTLEIVYENSYLGDFGLTEEEIETLLIAFQYLYHKSNEHIQATSITESDIKELYSVLLLFYPRGDTGIKEISENLETSEGQKFLQSIN